MTSEEIRKLGAYYKSTGTYHQAQVDMLTGDVLLALAEVMDAVNESDCIGYGYADIISAVSNVEALKP